MDFTKKDKEHNRITKALKPLVDYIDPLTAELDGRGYAPKIPIRSLPKLNEKIWGFRDGELVIIGARSSQGKSALAGQLAWDFADQNIPTLFLSLEMQVIDILERIFCYQMEVDNIELLKGGKRKNKEIDDKFTIFKQMVEQAYLYITCGVGKTFPEVLKVIEILDPTPKVVIVDYIQAIKTTTGESREGLDEYIRQFRQYALERKFCGILCSQINRGVLQTKDRRPDMAQLKSTGTLEEHADKVLLLHWDHYYDSAKPVSDFTLTVAKNRNGRTGDHYLNFEPNHYRFADCSEMDEARRNAEEYPKQS